jgi:hypothetical protein
MGRNRAFGAPCAIVGPNEWLKELDDRAMICFSVGYKYAGGGYQVWDPKHQGVVKQETCVLCRWPAINDADIFVVWPAPKYILEPPMLPNAPPLPQPPATPHTDRPEHHLAQMLDEQARCAPCAGPW